MTIFVLLKIRKYLQGHHFMSGMFSTLSLNKLRRDICHSSINIPSSLQEL